MHTDVSIFKILLTAGVIGMLAGCASSGDSMGMATSAEPAGMAKEAMAAGGMDSSAALGAAAMGGSAMAGASGGSLTDKLVADLGVTPTQASGGAGAIFGAAKTNMSPTDFAQVSDAVPDMNSLLGAAPAMGGVGALGGASALGGGVPGLSGGGVGGMAGMAAGAGALGGLAGPFGDLGMSPDMVGKFVPVIMDYVQTSGGAATAGLLQGALF
jgi:hypothetical protein